MFGRTAIRALSAGKLSILIYHRVLTKPDPFFAGDVDAATFEWQMRWLQQHCQPLALAEGVRRLRDGSLPKGAVCVTFDDGYRDNAEVALPILQRWKIPATIFVSTGFLDGSCMWNDVITESVRMFPGDELDLSPLGLGAFPCATIAQKRDAIGSIIGTMKYITGPERDDRLRRLVDHMGVGPVRDLMMSPEQVKALADAGVEIGAHTENHYILSRLTDEQAREQVARSKERLRQITARPIRFFAYPNGKPGQDYTGAHTRIIRELGFEAAVSTAWGVSTPTCDVFQLPRFTPWARTPWKFGVQMLQNWLRTQTDAVSD